MVKQGDIIYLDFNPQTGHEQAGRRPCLVVSNDLFNRINNMTLVCPIKNSHQKTPFQVPLDERTEIKGCILCDQAKMLDIEARHYERKEMLPSDILKEVLDILIGIIE